MPNFVYTLKERIEMVRQREQGYSYRRIVDHFAAESVGRPIPSTATVRNIIWNFEKTGNVTSKLMKVTQPSKQLSEEMKFDICLKAEEDPNKPVTQIAKELKVSKSSVRRILRWAKIRYSEPEKDENKNHDDKNEPIFSENMMKLLKVDESHLRRVCFGNESTILFISKSDKQNILVCSWRIQHRLFSQSDIPYQKLHVWSGAVGNQPVGPFFINGILNGESYLKLLKEKIIPALKAMDAEKGPIIWYQRDGVPSYYTADVFSYLNEQFSNNWIGRDCQIQQLTCAFDMSLLDHALSGRLKNFLYAGEQIQDLSILQNKVSEIFASMDPAAVCNTIRAYYDRGLRKEDDACR